MTTSPHTCCPECLVFSDDFSGASIGCQWDQRSGSWSLSSSQLAEAGNEDALIVVQRSVSDISFHLAATTPTVPENSMYRLIVNYVDDDNYHFAEFEFTSADLTIRLCRRSGGSDSILKERTWDGGMVDSPQSFGVCFTEKIFSAGQQYAPYMLWMTDPTPIEGGYQAGLGNGAEVAIAYDDLYLSEHLDTNDDCNYCVCRCDAVPLPMTLKATVTFADSLEDCEPVEVTLEAIATSVDPDFGTEWANGYWYGTAEVDCSGCAAPIDPFEIQLACNCLTELRVKSDDVGADSTVSVSQVTCDPLSVIFEVPHWVSGGYCSGQSGDSGDLQIEITIPEA